MSDSSASSPSGRVAALAESFLERYRKGERPALAEYTDRYPELADEIRLVFPAMVEMERLGQGRPSPPARSPTASRPTARRSVRSATTWSSARSAGAAWAWSTRPSRPRWAGTWP